ncbi:hypothetical protein BJX62DRAFT_232545 [Aspergillus germanicus]
MNQVVSLPGPPAPAPAPMVVLPALAAAAPAWPPAALLPPCTATRGTFTPTMVNIWAAPAARDTTTLQFSLLPANTPRAAWDRAPPAPATAERWATAQFVDLPPAAWFIPRSQAHPVAVPGLPPWTGVQTLLTRERRWALALVLRPAFYCGWGEPGQLATRV